MATYMIKNVQTKRFINTIGNEEAGEPVNTYFGSSSLTFSNALDGSETLTSIKGDSGLYINPGSGGLNYPIWSPAEFTWNAVLTDSAESHYELIPANGQDLYWTQNRSDEFYVTLSSGDEITGYQAVWEISDD
ncbi:hypothetical protein F5887DRAFT_1282139 [Amanita rubescens]|nr:hypothetical protein F5887DRAFT_1282139 [Amanita rubescens]